MSAAAADAPQARRGRREPTPTELLARANEAARQRPETTSFTQARQIYTYAPGAIYELYTSPSFISAILLEPGESLGDVAAGDTSRWMVQETSAEAGIDGRTIVLVKPQSTGLRTNIVLVTDRRTYTIEAIAQAGSAYSAQIAWCYPAEEQARMASVDALNFGYRVRATRGGRPNWMPTRVFDDGRRTWIEMPETVASSDLPPLFVITGEGAELVNYRVQGHARADHSWNRRGREGGRAVLDRAGGGRCAQSRAGSRSRPSARPRALRPGAGLRLFDRRCPADG
ncbi:MAG: TrbG/VirB9 family P-type conjugative transfer protein [Hyphomonadaceae bacterium]|nr:TrbG/VirB9 family P-type conjugative transfer protein [Hyphomonadaceae bacterium]